MGLFQSAEDYVLKVGLKRAAGALASYVIGHLLTGSVIAALNKGGVSVDPGVAQKAIEGALATGVFAFHDWLRMKPGFQWL